ncbi:hypothetical protein NKI12_30085 [Mesorhizobium australicum]|uniref:Uncharacterized protein n=1 Tax=Mesorhizobium australicum TaxID=536018 RepID=A0ACC6T4S5_9HYPH
MIDLHSHILPGLDDGSSSLAESLEMARLAVADGTTHMVCTPHVMPGVHENGTTNIAQAVEALVRELARAGIPLVLYVGAEGRVDIIASDAHGLSRRRPGLSQAVVAIANRWGEDEAYNMAVKRPVAILQNRLLAPIGKVSTKKLYAGSAGRFGGLGRLFKSGSLG